MSKKKSNTQEQVYRKKLIRRRKPNRSVAGDIALYLFLVLVAFIMAFPIIYAVGSALKPLDELFRPVACPVKAARGGCKVQRDL